MNNIIEVIQSVGPACVAILGVVVSCGKVISQFKEFKINKQKEELILKENVDKIVQENAELKKTVRQLTEVVTKIKQEGD